MKKVVFSLFLILLVFPLSVGASSIEEQRKAVLATAEAYYSQGSQLEYDSYKKNLYSTPEDATSKHHCYTVCSGLTFMSYYQALGIRVPHTTQTLLEYAKKNVGNKSIVPYYYEASTSSKTSQQAFQDLLQNHINEIAPGDILVWTGHAMMVKSVNVDKKTIRIIHASGGRYDYVNHEDKVDKNGAISYDSLSSLKSSKAQIALIRVITGDSTFIDSNGNKVSYDITESARTRMQYPNIDIGKIINNVDNQSFASPGDELTYQLRIRNKGNVTYKNISVVENVDSNLVLVNSGNGTVNGKQIRWNISSIAPGEYVTLLYTVKVPTNISSGKIVVSTGKVGGIATSRIETLIGKRLSQNDKAKLKTSFDKLKSNSKASTSRGFINALYKDALNLDLGISALNNLGAIGYSETNKSGGGNSLSVKYTWISDSTKKYLYSNFYGLRLAKDFDKTNSYVKASLAWNFFPTYELNDRARTLNANMLEDGDIILAYVGRNSATDTAMGNKGYIYLDNTLYRYRADSETKPFEIITGDALTSFLNNLIGENFIILRPYLKSAVGISVSKLPSKVTYVQNASSLKLTGGELTIAYDDGSNDSVSLDNKNVKVSGFDSRTPGVKTISVGYNGFTTSFNVEVVPKKITKIAVKKLPTKTSYTKNVEKLDLTGGTFVASYDDGTSEVISLKSSKVKVTGFDNSKAGNNTLTVEYEGLKTNFKVKIIEKKGTIAIAEKPFKETYVASSEELDLTGGVLTVIEGDGTKENVSLDNENIKVSGFDNSKVGIENVTIEYEGQKLDFPVEVVDKKVSSITLSSLPVKTNYIYGIENLDLTGGVINITYEDGTTDLMSLTNDNILVNGFDNSKVGTNSISVQYRDVNTSFDVVIVNKKIIGIEVTNKPTKATYIVDKENLDLTDGIITISYEDGTSDSMSLTNADIKISGFDNSKVGTNNLDVEYGGYKTSFSVEIIDGYKTGNSFNNLVIIGCGLLVLITVSLVGGFIYKKKRKPKFIENI